MLEMLKKFFAAIIMMIVRNKTVAALPIPPAASAAIAQTVFQRLLSFILKRMLPYLFKNKIAILLGAATSAGPLLLNKLKRIIQKRLENKKKNSQANIGDSSTQVTGDSTGSVTATDSSLLTNPPDSAQLPTVEKDSIEGEVLEITEADPDPDSVEENKNIITANIELAEVVINSPESNNTNAEDSKLLNSDNVTFSDNSINSRPTAVNISFFSTPPQNRSIAPPINAINISVPLPNSTTAFSFFVIFLMMIMAFGYYKRYAQNKTKRALAGMNKVAMDYRDNKINEAIDKISLNVVDDDFLRGLLDALIKRNDEENDRTMEQAIDVVSRGPFFDELFELYLYDTMPIISRLIEQEKQTADEKATAQAIANKLISFYEKTSSAHVSMKEIQKHMQDMPESKQNFLNSKITYYKKYYEAETSFLNRDTIGSSLVQPYHETLQNFIKYTIAIDEKRFFYIVKYFEELIKFADDIVNLCQQYVKNTASINTERSEQMQMLIQALANVFLRCKSLLSDSEVYITIDEFNSRLKLIVEDAGKSKDSVLEMINEKQSFWQSSAFAAGLSSIANPFTSPTKFEKKDEEEEKKEPAEENTNKVEGLPPQLLFKV